MGEFKFTKGKWKVGASKRSIINDDKVIARCAFGENSLGLFKEYEAEANALLISKAPQMLEMLKIARDKFLDLKHDKNLPELQEIQDQIEQLIKEATEIKE